jgi:4-amino-4-deoxy-L-arabinose transferase-like glycosyltransferase
MATKLNLQFGGSTILALAIVLRLIWAVLVPVIPVSDGIAYDTLARMIVDHGVYGWQPHQLSAYWPVGTSALYAALYLVFGQSYVPIVALNIILGVAIVELTMRLGRLFFDENTALLAGLLMAIWPSKVSYVTVLASELPFTFLVLLGLCAAFDRRLSVPARAALSGLAFGLAAYFRPIALLLPIVVWLSWLPDWRQLRRQLAPALLSMIVIAATVAPWSARNTLLFGHFVLLSTNGGVNFWMGNNPATTGSYMDVPSFVSEMDEYERDKALGREAMQYIFAEPVQFVLRTIKKAALLHVGETMSVHWNAPGITQRFGESALFPLKLVTQAFWTATLLCALAGLMVKALKDGLLRTITNPIVLTWLYFSAFYAAILIQDRFHFPSHPLVALLASVAILRASKRIQAVKKSTVVNDLAS